MPEMHLRQLGFTFTYATCDQFTNNKEKIKKNRIRRFKIYLSK